MHTKIKMSVSTFDTDSTAASAHMGYDHKIYELHDKIKKINEKFTKNFGSLSDEELQQMDEEEEVLFEMIEKRKEEILARMRLKKVIAIIEKDAAKL